MVASPSHNAFGNDEDTWFGSDDRDAESRAEQSVAAVGARIIGAKPFPIAARRLEELTRNPKARLEQVVSVLETDPGLSVRLLRLVNSAGYGLKVRVTSVRHAAVLVGTRRLHQVATTAAILDLFETSNETAIQLLEHAAVVGSLCRYLAVHLGLPHDELFTCGFLHDIGKLMLLDTEGDKYATLVQLYGEAPDQLHVQERKLFGFDHAVLGAHVLTAWNIPEPVPKVVAFHHNPARAMQDTLLASMVYTLRLADMMSYALALETDAEGVAMVTESEAAQYLEISEPQVAAMWGDLRALAERSRARSHGQPDLEVVAPRRLDVPRSLRPRRSGAPRSLRPGDAASIPAPAAARAHSRDQAPSSAPSRSSDVNEVPVHFPCVACSKPSFGNLCAACDGYVCPEHQVGLEHWCVMCVTEYEKFRTRNPVPGYLKVTGLALAGFSVSASVTGVLFSQTFAVWKLIVAPVTMVLLWGVLLPVAHRLWQRTRFVRSRPKGRVPLPIKLPRPNPVFISSLDANLENEGLMGPSMPPPSQGSISIVAAPAVAPPAEPQLPLTQPVVTSDAPAPEPQPPAAPITDRSPAPEATKSEIKAVAAPLEAPPPSERELDEAAAELERTSDMMLKAEPVAAPPEAPAVAAPLGASAGPLVGAAASLNPPAQPSLAPKPATDSIAQHIAALLGEPTAERGFSEFPSLGSGNELEQVVASVSARLVRELPNNDDYTGPSADLRAATIAPIPEPHSATPVVAVAPAMDEPVVSAPVAEVAELPVPEAPVAQVPDAAPSIEERAIAEAVPVLEAAAPVELAPAAPAVESVLPAPVLKPLIVPRKNLNQYCVPRRVYKCAAPIAESCAPAPRRTSLRPPPSDFGAAEGTATGPATIRGLG